jgi:predicted RNase H-like nuclease (RuvC/YqgF family)
MQVKTISYKRVLNIGNYENKHLELFGEVLEGEDEEEAISRLMEMVERKVREPREREIVALIKKLEATASNLREQNSYLEQKLGELKSKEEQLTNVQEPDPDDIPFDSGGPTSDDPADF